MSVKFAILAASAALIVCASPRAEAFDNSSSARFATTHVLDLDRIALSDPDAADESTTATIVEDPTGEAPGTITVDTTNYYLYLSQPGGEAIRYTVGVGREGFLWKGEAHIGRKAEWPTWTPPANMLKRRPSLPKVMAGGLDNPLGARALYLFDGGRDTEFRIHGTNDPTSIGQSMSSGCIRMMNADVMDLYNRVPIGADVKVL